MNTSAESPIQVLLSFIFSFLQALSIVSIFGDVASLLGINLFD